MSTMKLIILYFAVNTPLHIIKIQLYGEGKYELHHLTNVKTIGGYSIKNCHPTFLSF